MNFGPDLAELIAKGEKTVTRRMPSDNPRSPWFRGGCSLKVDGDYAVCPGRGKHAIARVRITAVDLEPLGRRLTLPDRPGHSHHGNDASFVFQIVREAQAEGFRSTWEFQDRWKELHGEWDPTVEVWRIEFELVERP